MKKSKICLTALLLSILIIGCTATQNRDKKTVEDSTSGFETKTSESGVTINLMPKGFNNGKLYVDISVNTHTVNLDDYDLKSLTVLEFEGKSIKPISAPKLSGHHTSGTLIFDTGKELKAFKIKIKGFPDIEERVFEWP